MKEILKPKNEHQKKVMKMSKQGSTPAIQQFQEIIEKREKLEN